MPEVSVYVYGAADGWRWRAHGDGIRSEEGQIGGRGPKDREGHPAVRDELEACLNAAEYLEFWGQRGVALITRSQNVAERLCGILSFRDPVAQALCERVQAAGKRLGLVYQVASTEDCERLSIPEGAERCHCRAWGTRYLTTGQACCEKCYILVGPSGP